MSEDMRIHSHAMGFTNLLCLLSYALVGVTLTNGQSGQKCYDTVGNFTANSIYGKNRNLVLSTLASNVSTNEGFYTATIGQETNKVYALALCRGDYSSERCFNCVNSTTQDLITKCPNQKEALSWGVSDNDPCIVRYANRFFFGILELQPMQPNYNADNFTTYLTQFDQVWEILMDSVVRKASTGSSKLKFATEEKNFTYFQKIYALMQCTPDLSRMDCESCLRQSVTEYQRCCHGKRGGFVTTPNCIFRWNLYPFYESDASSTPLPEAPSPPPQRTSSTRERRGITSATVGIIVVSIIIFLALVAFTVVLLWRKSKKEIRSMQERNDADDEIETVESLQFDFGTIKAATNNFSTDCKLGEGGFGAVHKGRLPDSQDIAVKRLSKESGQGELEFKNEVILVAKLQHRNLVRLRGFCFEGKERLLVYEFVQNSSLDKFIFDPTKRLLLDWKRRYEIMGGIA